MQKDKDKELRTATKVLLTNIYIYLFIYMFACCQLITLMNRMPYQISFSPTGGCARRIQNNALAQVNEGPGQRVAGSFAHLDSFILLCYYFRKSGAFTSLSDAVFGEVGNCDGFARPVSMPRVQATFYPNHIGTASATELSYP